MECTCQSCGSCNASRPARLREPSLVPLPTHLVLIVLIVSWLPFPNPSGRRELSNLALSITGSRRVARCQRLSNPIQLHPKIPRIANLPSSLVEKNMSTSRPMTLISSVLPRRLARRKTQALPHPRSHQMLKPPQTRQSRPQFRRFLVYRVDWKRLRLSHPLSTSLEIYTTISTTMEITCLIR